MKKLKLSISFKKSYKNDHEQKLPNFFLYVKRNAMTIQEKCSEIRLFIIWGIKMTSNMKKT